MLHLVIGHIVAIAVVRVVQRVRGRAGTALDQLGQQRLPGVDLLGRASLKRERARQVKARAVSPQLEARTVPLGRLFLVAAFDDLPDVQDGESGGDQTML